jgi:hypothetical protein
LLMRNIVSLKTTRAAPEVGNARECGVFVRADAAYVSR